MRVDAFELSREQSTLGRVEEEREHQIGLVVPASPAQDVGARFEILGCGFPRRRALGSSAGFLIQERHVEPLVVVECRQPGVVVAEQIEYPLGLRVEVPMFPQPSTNREVCRRMVHDRHELEGGLLDAIVKELIGVGGGQQEPLGYREPQVRLRVRRARGAGRSQRCGVEASTQECRSRQGFLRPRRQAPDALRHQRHDIVRGCRVGDGLQREPPASRDVVEPHQAVSV